jgi:hypothetical protein
VEERRSVGGDELLARTPVLWAYRPVRIVALEGQQSGVVATALLNRVPPSWKKRRVFGMTSSVPSARWSSVTMTSMFGRALCAADGLAE